MLRCVLDPWNTDYYALPAIVALISWEALARGAHAGARAAADGGDVGDLAVDRPAAPPDVEALVYLGWSLPLVGLLAWRLYAPAIAMPALSRGGRASVWSTTQ